ncbi:type I-E CRISPR-associated protein Cse1/CasA [Amycolatopsis lurida]
MKPDGDELAARARDAITALHCEPRFNLAEQPWIPVMRDGALSIVGLRELLATAHLITDLALPHPLLRASLRRLLGALTADMVRRDPSLSVEDWEDFCAANAGFTDSQVSIFLEVHGDHLWLWHPRTPFLQDQRLAANLVSPQDDQAVQELVTHLPSGLSATWWVKAHEPALAGGLTEAETALWLTSRWFYAAACNCATLRLPDGSTSTSHSGGCFAETLAPITHAFRVDGTSLFRSMLRGLPAGLPEPATAAGPGHGLAGCAWLDEHQPRPSSDPLYLATLNPAAVLLTGRDPDGTVTRLVRASTPVDKKLAKQLRNVALDADAHRVTAVAANGTRRAVRVPPTTLRGELLAGFHRAGFDGQALAGVVTSSGCWLHTDPASADQERLELLLVSKKGTGAAPVWEELVGMDLPARHVDPTHPDARVVEHVQAAVHLAFDPLTGVRRNLERAVGDLLARPGPDGWTPPKLNTGLAEALVYNVTHAWLARTTEAFDRVLSSATPDDLERWRTAAWSAARAAFHTIAAPYITSSRYAPRYAHALRHLTPRTTP